MDTDKTTPYGTCKCGCGRKTWIPPTDDAHHGYVAGVPVDYCHGHFSRKPIEWREQDTGYDSPCWVWTGTTDALGYGKLTRDNVKWLAHRYFYAQRHGEPLPDTLDHLCRVPACVNPDHLEPTSRGENIRRGIRATLTWDAVTDIRASSESNVALAKRHGVAACTISNVRAGRNWKEEHRP